MMTSELHIGGLVDRPATLDQLTFAVISAAEPDELGLVLADLLSLACVRTDADLLEVTTPTGEIVLIPLRIATRDRSARLVLVEPGEHRDGGHDRSFRLTVPQLAPSRSEWPVASISATTFASFVS